MSRTETCIAAGSDTYTKDVGRLATRGLSVEVYANGTTDDGAAYNRDLSLGWHDRYAGTTRVGSGGGRRVVVGALYNNTRTILTSFKLLYVSSYAYNLTTELIKDRCSRPG